MMGMVRGEEEPESWLEPWFDVVVIASSAGGLKALRLLLEELPAQLPAAIVIVQHLDPNHPSSLAGILARGCKLPVKQVEEGDEILPGRVYIAPPGHHVLITGQCTLALGRGDLVQFVRPSADVLFKSAAKQYGRRLIAVVLTGTGKDGSAGIKAVKEMGGFTIAQQQSNAEYSGMPRSAIDTGAVDLVLPLEKIAVNIQSLIRSGEKDDH